MTETLDLIDPREEAAEQIGRARLLGYIMAALAAGLLAFLMAVLIP